MSEFLRDCCVLDPAAFAASGELIAAYEAWLRRTQAAPLSRAAFRHALADAGIRQSRRRRVDGVQFRAWEGIGLKPQVSKGSVK